MAVAYVATSASIYTLRKKHTAKFNLPGGLTIPILAAAFSIYLITQCNLTQIGLGLVLLLIGVPIYIKYAPKKEIAELKQALLNRQNILKRLDNQEHVFFAHLLRHIKKLYGKTKQE